MHHYAYGLDFSWGRHQEEDDGHPFTYDVMAVPVPFSFKPLANLDAYDGSTNP